MTLARSRIQRVEPNESPEIQWLTTGECAKRLGVTSKLIARWIDNGRLLGFALPDSKHRRVSAIALAAFEASEGFRRARGIK
jgi:excisionase family DNA binding protein